MKSFKTIFKWPGRSKPDPQEEYAFIELRNVSKVYGAEADSPPALRDVSLTVQAGEMAAIAGKSGSGKSTLLNMLTGIDRPTTGEIFIQNVPLHRLNEEQLTGWRGKTVGIVFQFFQLIPTMTLLENIVLPMDFCNHTSPRARRERALRLLEEVGLSELSHRLPSNVSGGQQQRAAIARALANDPAILVADEPTGNLDSASAEIVFALLQRQAAAGKTVLIVTHDHEFARRCQRMLLLSDGQIVHDQMNSGWQAPVVTTEAPPVPTAAPL